MYAASLLFSRLTFIGMLAFPAWVVSLGMIHAHRGDAIPPCQHAVVEAPAPQVEEAAFGLSDWREGEGYSFIETDHIHLEPGTTFGWRLKLREPMSDTNQHRSMMLREEFVLPAAPAYWGLGPDTRLNDDRTVAVTERRVHPRDGWLSREWTVTTGDPAGAYEMRVFLDDELVQTFQFEAHASH